MSSLAFPQVCDCQHQFARWDDGQQRRMPVIGGCQGTEFTHVLLDIEKNLERGLQKLRSVDKFVFDIKNETWSIEFKR